MFHRLERIQQFVSAGVDVNAVDSESTQNSPLHWAACYSDAQIISYLVGKLSVYILSLSIVYLYYQFIV